jgi:disulfide bond formation protein DsbB
MNLETINTLLGIGTIGLLIGSAVLLLLFILSKRSAEFAEQAAYVERWGILAALVLSLGSSLVTIIHSTVFGLPPCPLCYWQRIFLYPQVILFTLALWRREKWMAEYSIILSVIGLGIAIYHHVLQMFPMGFLPCPAEGGVSCAQIFFLEFGFITYPFMAIALFVFLIILMLFVKRSA